MNECAQLIKVQIAHKKKKVSGAPGAAHRNVEESITDQGSLSAQVSQEKTTTDQGSVPERHVDQSSRMAQEEVNATATSASDQGSESTEENDDSDSDNSSLGWSDESSPEWTGFNSDKDDSDNEWSDAWSKRHEDRYTGLVTNPYLRKLKKDCHPCNPKTVHPCPKGSIGFAACSGKRLHGNSEVSEAKQRDAEVNTYGITFRTGSQVVRRLNVGRLPRLPREKCVSSNHKPSTDAAKTKLLALENLNPFVKDQFVRDQAKNSTDWHQGTSSPRSRPGLGSKTTNMSQGTSDVIAQGIGLLVALLIVLVSANLHAVVAASTTGR